MSELKLRPPVPSTFAQVAPFATELRARIVPSHLETSLREKLFCARDQCCHDPSTARPCSRRANTGASVGMTVRVRRQQEGAIADGEVRQKTEEHQASRAGDKKVAEYAGSIDPVVWLGGGAAHALDAFRLWRAAGGMTPRSKDIIDAQIACAAAAESGWCFDIECAPRDGRTCEIRYGGTRVEVNVEKVKGIGGLFFRAKDPKGLAEWYRAHLGVDLVPTNYDMLPWQQEAGPTAFAPFAADTKYFGDPAKQFMINFRVGDLEAMAMQLRAAGIAVEIDVEKYPNGRFARIHDPEGNPIELWEPKGK
jgi:glyoxylase I family protein